MAHPNAGILRLHSAALHSAQNDTRGIGIATEFSISGFRILRVDWWSMNSSLAIRLAAITGFLAVALGAFGAHALQATLADHGTVAIWQTGALYHLVHAV